MKIAGTLTLRIGLFICGLYVVIGALTQCAGFNVSKKSLEKQFKGFKEKPALHTYEVDGHPMEYCQMGSDTLPVVLFVHGSPGGWSAYLDYFKDSAFMGKACLVAVNRAGYGNSGPAEPSLQMQAALIAPLLNISKSGQKPILVGHSLGGPIIARMAMDYPDKIKSLIFLAPSIDPDMEKKEPYRKFLKLGIVRAIMPHAFVSSNVELMPLKKELMKMMPMWQNIKVPCTILHGKKDMLVPYGNVAFYEHMLIHAPKREIVAFENENHFIPWTQYDTVKKVILEHLEDK